MTSGFEPQAEALLREGEGSVPEPVHQTASFLRERGVWFHLSRNQEARSCRDAAHKRDRLGHVGIPLRDEMKSFFGRVSGPGGRPRHVMAHCRGDRQLDLYSLAKAIGATDLPDRLTDDELRRFGIEYGLVNPFETWQPWALDGRVLHAPVLQVFDADLLQPLGAPGTVMTNAGDLTWAVEFRAAELVRALHAEPEDHTLVAEIAADDPRAPRRPAHLSGRRSIAIITGNGPESGIALWTAINGRVRELLGDDNTGDTSMPPVRVVSLPEQGLTMELDTRADHVWSALEPVVREICETDAAFLSIACNTTQYFVDRLRAICDPAGVEFVCLPEVVAEWLDARRVREVALIGIPYVAELDGGWSAYADPFAHFQVEKLRDRAFDRLVDLAYDVKAEGPTEGGLNQLRAILNQEVKSDHVVLALTELSILLARQRRAGRGGKTLIDPVAIYADALARKWMGLPYPPPPAGWAVQVTGFTHHGARRLPSSAELAGNEDGALVGTRLLPADRSPRPFHSVPSVHQEVVMLGADGPSPKPVLAAVADGLGGHVRGAEASRFVLHRVRDAADKLREPDDADRVVRLAAEGLAEEAVRAGDPRDQRRGTTLAAIAVSDPLYNDRSLAATWLSVGDCVMARLTRSPGRVGVELLCTPDADTDNQPTNALGAAAVPACRSGGMRVDDSAVFLLCTDGFVSSFGLAPWHDDLADRLAEHSALAPVWARLLEGSGDPSADRAAAEELFDAARSAWPDAVGDASADNLTVVLLRLLRSGGPDQEGG